EHREGQLRIADQGIVHFEVAVDVGRVERGVDVGLAGRKLDAVRGRRETAADAEDQVGALKEMVYRPRQRAAARAKGKRMRLRKRALAFQAGRDRGLEQFGEPAKLLPGLGRSEEHT